MNSDRLWVIAAVAVMGIIAVAGWFVGISPVVSAASAASDQAASITTANQASEAKLVQLKSEFANIAPLQATLDKLRESIPDTVGAPAFLQELNGLATANNVTITSVTIASATVYTAPGTTAAAPAASSTDSTATPTPTPTPATATTTPTTTPVAAGGQFVQIPVTIAATGNFGAVRDFMGAVQTGTRLYVASSVGLAEGSSSGSGGSATLTMTGNIFTLQGTSAPEKTTTPTISSTPTATPTPTSTPTSISTTTPTPGSTPTTKP
jgi:Tfp pilus assembly protein PilO